MSEHKPDELTSTGSHRAWNPGLIPPVAPKWPPAAPTQPTNRHAAITRSLKNFPSYKSWTDKIKNSWKPEKDKE